MIMLGVSLGSMFRVFVVDFFQNEEMDHNDGSPSTPNSWNSIKSMILCPLILIWTVWNY